MHVIPTEENDLGKHAGTPSLRLTVRGLPFQPGSSLRISWCCSFAHLVLDGTQQLRSSLAVLSLSAFWLYFSFLCKFDSCVKSGFAYFFLSVSYF